MIVKINNLSYDFKGIAKVDGKVTFVANALPDEVVNVKLLEEKKNYNRGKVISYIEKSNDRTRYLCPYSDRCGGCDFGGIVYSKQLEYKKNIVMDIFKRYINACINPNIVGSDKIVEYRNKISLKIYNGKVSLSEEGSNNLVNIDNCLLVNDKINDIIKLLSGTDLTGISDVIIRGTDNIMVIFNGEYNCDDIIRLLYGKVSSIIYNGKCIYGEEYIMINVGKYKYAIYPDSFFQVNTVMIKKLYDKVKEYAGSGESLLDLYCGAGSISIYLSENFKMVRGIEINKAAIEGANLNKTINGIFNVSFELANVNTTYIDEDVVVVDPPRGGLDDKTRKMLFNSKVKKIVYVSCNPLTLARDINILKEKYDIIDVTLFDNFPNTKHVECVSLLSLKTLEK